MTQISGTTQIPIDPMDIKRPLEVVLEKETKLINKLYQMSFTDEKKNVVRLSPVVWVKINGYLTKAHGFVFERNTPPTMDPRRFLHGN
jgi:hypothetical protein